MIKLLALQLLLMGLSAVSAADVIVIGAGISGLTAARTILEEDPRHNVILLESRDRVGGRMHTISESEQPDWAPMVGAEMDAGASWMHGSSPAHPANSLVRRLNLDTFLTDYDSLRLKMCVGSQTPSASSGCPAVTNPLYSRFNTILNRAQNNAFNLDSDIDLWSALRGVTASGMTRDTPLFLFHLASSFMFDYAAHPRLQSAWEVREGDEITGTEEGLVGGFMQLPTALARGTVSSTGGSGSNSPLDIRFSTTVTAISQTSTAGDTKVEIRTAQGRTYTADRVIVTLPGGVLKSNTVSFSPQLSSQKRAAIQGIGFGNIVKVGLLFDSVFWSSQETFGVVHDGEGATAAERFSFFLNYAPTTGRPVLHSYVFGDSADVVESWTDTQLWAAIRPRLVELFGETAVSSVPRPKLWHSVWRSDPFARGAYSYPAVGFRAAQYDHLGAPEWSGRLLFAGEHTDKSFRSSVHGAMRTGRIAGLAIGPAADEEEEEEEEEDGEAFVSTPHTQVSAVTATDTWQTVVLSDTYVSPVVFCMAHLSSSTAPAVVPRLRDASGNSFDVKLQHAGGSGDIPPTAVTCLTLEEGLYPNMEAATFSTTKTNRKGFWLSTRRPNTRNIASPVVLTQIQSYNDPQFQYAFASSNTVTSPPTASHVFVGRGVGEDSRDRAAETVGYLIVSAGSGVLPGTSLNYHAVLSGTKVAGAPGATVAYSSPGLSAENAKTAVGGVAGMRGGDGGWVRSIGANPIQHTGARVVIDEDVVVDAERRHTSENVALLVFDTTGDVVPQPSPSPAPPAGPEEVTLSGSHTGITISQDVVVEGTGSAITSPVDVVLEGSIDGLTIRTTLRVAPVSDSGGAGRRRLPVDEESHEERLQQTLTDMSGVDLLQLLTSLADESDESDSCRLCGMVKELLSRSDASGPKHRLR